MLVRVGLSPDSARRLSVRALRSHIVRGSKGLEAAAIPRTVARRAAGKRTRMLACLVACVCVGVCVCVGRSVIECLEAKEVVVIKAMGQRLRPHGQPLLERHAPTPSMPLIEQCIDAVVPVDATKRQRGVGGVTGRGQPGKRRWALVNWLPRGGGGWIGESCWVTFSTPLFCSSFATGFDV